MVLSVDYYNIEIEDQIGTYKPQDVLDACYGLGDLAQCDKIVRVGGTLTNSGSGIFLLTENLVSLEAEGIEVGATLNFALGGWGDLAVSANYNKFLTQEYLTDEALPVTDCLGYYGNSCGNPLPEDRWIQRTTWSYGAFDVSYLWRHIGEARVERPQLAQTYGPFQKIDAYDYVDLYASYRMFENTRLSVGVTNVFDKDPPVVGNEAGTTDANSGNTFPSVYEVLGRVFTVGVNVKF
jgi:iron complex outermembrane recepter protein